MLGLRFILKERWLFRELLHSSPPANRSGLYKNDVMMSFCSWDWCSLMSDCQDGDNGDQHGLIFFLSISQIAQTRWREDCEAGRWCQADSSDFVGIEIWHFSGRIHPVHDLWGQSISESNDLLSGWIGMGESGFERFEDLKSLNREIKYIKVW